MTIAKTARLRLRHLEMRDAAFFMRQVNEPSWIANIGERNVRSVADAERYLETVSTPDNDRSGRLLFKLGFVLEGPIRMPPKDELLTLYSADLGTRA